ncbi:hypothetical protein [Pontibacter pamirensis]|uniref:hypothetical protein n=1 Tax=Pontibacter pamirensis TaxID=2562824 RepID=UPI001389A06E|nr:hypothetical protein [Pontibacter pamirensis]
MNIHQTAQQRKKEIELLQMRTELIKWKVEEHFKRHTVAAPTQSLLNDLAEQYALLTSRLASALGDSGHAVTPTNEELTAYNNDLWEQFYTYQREQLKMAVTLTNLFKDVEKLKKKTRAPRKKKDSGDGAEPSIITL